MRKQGALMKAAGSFTVTGSSGHTITFEANKQVYVPPVMVEECKKYGAEEVKRVKGLTSVTPDPAAIKSNLLRGVSNNSLVPVEEITLEELQEIENEESSNRDKVRAVIVQLYQDNSADDFTDDGIPKMAAINSLLDKDVTASVRNEIIAELEELGELPTVDDEDEDEDDG